MVLLSDCVWLPTHYMDIYRDIMDGNQPKTGLLRR